MRAVYGVLLVAHVVAAVVGTGAVVATGVAARAATRSPTPQQVRRYFKSGWNWPSLSILLVPGFGAGLEAAHGWPDINRSWPWIALTAWAVAVVTGVTVHWPAERTIQRVLAGPAPAGPAPAGARAGPAGAGLAAACRRAMFSSAAMTVAFLVALAVMVAQPR